MDKDAVYIHTHTHTHTHTHRNATQPGKRDKILPLVAIWIDLENIMLSEINQRQILYDITYMWNLKNTVEYKCKTETQI